MPATSTSYACVGVVTCTRACARLVASCMRAWPGVPAWLPTTRPPPHASIWPRPLLGPPPTHQVAVLVVGVAEADERSLRAVRRSEAQVVAQDERVVHGWQRAWRGGGGGVVGCGRRLGVLTPTPESASSCARSASSPCARSCVATVHLRPTSPRQDSFPSLCASQRCGRRWQRPSFEWCTGVVRTARRNIVKNLYAVAAAARLEVCLRVCRRHLRRSVPPLVVCRDAVVGLRVRVAVCRGRACRGVVWSFCPKSKVGDSSCSLAKVVRTP